MNASSPDGTSIEEAKNQPAPCWREELSDKSEAESSRMLPAVIQNPGSIEPVHKPRRIERDQHRQAFAYYFALGNDRTLAKVAGEFGVKEGTVLSWSAAFQWREKIAELEA